MTIGYHAVSVKTVSKITSPPFYALIVIFGVIINAMILSVRNIEFTKKNENEPFCCKKCLENIPFNGLNANEFNSFTKFDVIETRNGSNIKLTPTPMQQITIDKLNNLI